MKFDKDVLFLGKTLNTLSDGGQYFTVDLYDRETGTVKVNVMDNSTNRDTIKALDAADFGTPMTVTFALKPKDKLWRITIDHVS